MMVVVVRELLTTMKEGKGIYIEIEKLIDKGDNNGIYFFYCDKWDYYYYFPS